MKRYENAMLPAIKKLGWVAGGWANLGCNVVRSAAKGGRQVIRLELGATHAHVDQSDVAVTIQQHIVELQVSTGHHRTDTQRRTSVSVIRCWARSLMWTCNASGIRDPVSGSFGGPNSRDVSLVSRRTRGGGRAWGVFQGGGRKEFQKLGDKRKLFYSYCEGIKVVFFLSTSQITQ